MRIAHQHTALRSLRRHDGHTALSPFGARTTPPPRRAFNGWVLAPAPPPADRHPHARIDQIPC